QDKQKRDEEDNATNDKVDDDDGSGNGDLLLGNEGKSKRITSSPNRQHTASNPGPARSTGVPADTYMEASYVLRERAIFNCFSPAAHDANEPSAAVRATATVSASQRGRAVDK
ncbi:unnamed protein product, partial [Ceratitis capitata]